MIRSILALVGLGTMLSSPARLLGQQVTGSLVGLVTDSSGAAVAGARISATEASRNVSRETRSGEAGTYSIASMEPGVYNVEIGHGGFKRFVAPRIEVSVNSTVRVDATLAPGAVNEAIEVIAEGVRLQSDRSDLGAQIASTQIENLPLTLDRNYQSLLVVIPGATEPEPLNAGAIAPAAPQGPLQYNMNGQDFRTNGERVEGTVVNQINTQARVAVVTPAEAIQVVDVTTNAYDAEHGNASGAIVNVVLKSGSNQLHGSAFAFNSNSALWARNALSALPPPPANLNQYGFSVGGPIRRDRTFFFTDYQGSRDHRPGDTLLSVPSAEYRAGNFASSTTVLYDPATGTPTGANRTAFPGNVIPAARFSPIANDMIRLLPSQNLPGRVNNFAVAGTAIQNREAFDVKVNHNFNDRTQAFASYSYFQADTGEAAAFGELGGVGVTGGDRAGAANARNQRLSLNLTRVWSPTLLMELRAGFTRSHALLVSEVPADMASRLGIPGINRGTLATDGLPQFTFTDYSYLGVSSNLPGKIPDTAFNYVTNWTKTRGAHTIRWGGEIVVLRGNVAASVATRGQFAFGTGLTAVTGSPTSGANSFGAFLLGLPATTTKAAVSQLAGQRFKMYALFVQDRWQATRKFTVNYGVRYEVYPAMSVAKPGDQSLYDFSANRIQVAGFGPVNLRNNVATDWNDFAPRLGAAYRLNSRTVVRAGYGIGYNPLFVKNVNVFPAVITQTLQGANQLTSPGNMNQGIPDPPLPDVSSGVVANPPTNIELTARNLSPRRGYTQSYNLTVEREFLGFIVGASYVGALGTRNLTQQNVNTAGPGASTAQLPLSIAFGRASNTWVWDYMTPSAYHALQTKAVRRFSRRSMLTVTYTWSKSLDYVGNNWRFDNNLDIPSNRGVSEFNRTHNLVVSPTMALPFGRGTRMASSGTAGWLLGGWRVNGVFIARTGLPVSITGVRLAANAPQRNTNRPNRLSDARILRAQGPGQLYFDTSVFAEPAAGTWGNAGRNTLRGPGYVNLNAGVFREFAFSERVRLQFRLDAMNVTNTPHYGVPIGVYTRTDFGQITSTSGARQARLGLRLGF